MRKMESMHFPRGIFLQDVQKEILLLLFKTVVMVMYTYFFFLKESITNIRNS